jgi:Amt family ammonium transporter
LIGLGGGVVCYFAIQLRERLRVDDALDVWAVHGIGGTWGAIATGIFASAAVNPAGKDGLLYGNPGLFFTQLLTVVVAWVFCGVMTFIILKIVDAVIGLRVPEQEEVLGLDLSQHGEPAYQL